MRRWGIIVTTYYAVILVFLLLPWSQFIAAVGDPPSLAATYDDVLPALFDVGEIRDGEWAGWLFVAILVTSQALLLFLSVDTSYKRLRPRRHLAISVGMTVLAVGALTLAAIWSVGAAIWSDFVFDKLWLLVGAPLASWGFWGAVFYLYRERLSERFDETVTWLLTGSVLELLITVPCHVWVRNRGDCSAPFVTGYGIATGVAIMLMAFGPSVLFLYQRRLRDYEREPTPALETPRTVVSLSLGTLAAGTVALIFVMPVEDAWTLYPDIPEEQSIAATAAVIGVVESFGVTALPPDTTDLRRLMCRDEPIGYFRKLLPNKESVQTWTIWLRADQADLLFALERALQDYATPSFYRFEPAVLNRWRSSIAHGTFLRGGCRPQ